MHSEIYDYRNGKYQGTVSPQKLRQGLGIFVDDDLAFYVSHWADSKLSGPTLVYLAHGKYIYGEWVANQPHGLNVFRCGETVLVGQFVRGVPAGRCLLIFERHNFACILGERNGRWDIVDSGQLLNHRSLLGYLQFLEMPVPDHFFSLTKFACHFSNTSHLRTYPTANGCCYFGFPVGLGIVFNANNGVVSVGLHRNEELCEFGGRFDNSRQSEQGNFEHGGERIAFIGERPTAKIHAIFQKLHKRSLNFFNEYIDSRGKIFGSIQGLVKGKLRDIGEACRQEGQGDVDLNDSLDYQDYGEEESLKLNENREKMYSPPKRNMERGRTPNRQAENGLDGKGSTGNFFRKNPESKKKEEMAVSTRKEEEKAVYVVKRSPLKFERKDSLADLQRSQPERTEKLAPSIPASANKVGRGVSSRTASTTNLLQQAEATETDARQTQKMKEKMRANNLRYLNTPSNVEPVADKPAFRDLRREGSSSNLRKEEPAKLEYRVLKPSQEEGYRVPTFKGLTEEYELTRQRSGKLGEDKLEETSTFKNLKASINEEEEPMYGQPERKQPRQNQFPNFNEIQLTPKRQAERIERVERQEAQEKPARRHQLIEPQRVQEEEELPTTSVERRKRSIEVKALARPNYEDIEQRRKRILKSFQELNTQPPLPSTNVSKPDSPCHAVAVSGARDEPTDFGYIPLSISNKINQKTPIKRPMQKERPEEMSKGMENDRFKYQQRESGFAYGQGSESVKKDANERRKDTGVKEESRESGMLRRAPSYGYMNAMTSSKGEEMQGQTPSRTVPTSMQSSIGTTPTRPKRSYTYVYQ